MQFRELFQSLQERWPHIVVSALLTLLLAGCDTVPTDTSTTPNTLKPDTVNEYLGVSTPAPANSGLFVK